MRRRETQFCECPQHPKRALISPSYVQCLRQDLQEGLRQLLPPREQPAGAGQLYQCRRQLQRRVLLHSRDAAAEQPVEAAAHRGGPVLAVHAAGEALVQLQLLSRCEGAGGGGGSWVGNVEVFLSRSEAGSGRIGAGSGRRYVGSRDGNGEALVQPQLLSRLGQEFVGLRV